MDTPFLQAERGRAFWLDNSLDVHDIVLLLPGLEEDLTATLLAALDEKMEQMPNASALVLSPVPRPSGKRYIVRAVSGEVIADLLSLYCLYDFSDKLIVGSLDLPPGRKARNLIDSNAAPALDVIHALFF